MTVLTLPQARIQIGWATVRDRNGERQRLPVEVDIEWMRFFAALTDRVGGITGGTSSASTVAGGAMRMPEDGEDGERGPPGPQGPTGPQGLSYAIRGDDGEDGLTLFGYIARPYATHLDASRSLNTTYTNTSTSTLLCMVTARCAITAGAGTAYMQAKMDTASPPTVAASGVVGIESGLNGEDNSFQVCFLVNPGGTYRVDSTASNGTVTLGKWFEYQLG